MARRDDREYRAICEGATQPAGMHREPNATVIMKVSTKPREAGPADNETSEASTVTAGACSAV